MTIEVGERCQIQQAHLSFQAEVRKGAKFSRLIFKLNR
jgi:hypothetical protein